MTETTAFDALRASRLAAELTDEQCRTLAALITLRTLQEGEVLVAEGTSDDHLHAIISGALSVVRGAGSADEVHLLTLATGDLVGELSFIDGSVHYASLVARGATTVFAISRNQIESLLVSDPMIVYRVMRAILRTVHQIQRRLSAHTVELANYIYKQHGRY